MRKRRGEWITVSLSLAALVAIGGSQTIVAAQEVSSTYVVQVGDTLYSIASHHGLSLSQLKQINGLSTEMILPGQSLLVSQTSPNEDVSTPSTEEQDSYITLDDSTTEVTNTPPINNEVNIMSDVTLTGSTYTVRAGDSLYSIALKHGVTVQNLQNWNNLSNNYIYSGDVLKVSKSVATSPEVNENNNSNNNSAGNSTASDIHIVKAGESVNLIAQKYGVTANLVRSWNNLSSDLIHPGDRLVVSSSTKVTEDNDSNNTNNDTDNSTQSKTYTVKSGDYLYSIASKFGVTVQNLKDWNQLSSNYIYSGDVLNVAKPVVNIPTPSPKPEDNKDENVPNNGGTTKNVHVVKAGE